MFGEYMTLNGYDILVLGIAYLGIGIAINVGTREILTKISRTHEHLAEDLKVIHDDLQEVKARTEKILYGD